MREYNRNIFKDFAHSWINQILVDSVGLLCALSLPSTDISMPHFAADFDEERTQTIKAK